MKTRSYPLMLIVLTMVLGGCALSPQTVALKPRIDAPSHPIGQGRTLALEVVDQRPARHFGQRGGIYDTALITPRTDVDQTVRQALAERLTASGFVVVPPSPDAPLSMRVEIQRIDYLVSGDLLSKQIRAHAAMRVLTRRGERTLTTQYQANSARRVIVPPSESENEHIINEVVAQVLQRLLQDGAVLELLAD